MTKLWRIQLSLSTLFTLTALTITSSGCGDDIEGPAPNAICGDGTVDPGEECDDGNTTPGDGCSATCTMEAVPVCGNNIVEEGEACDDGNMVAFDGCETDCTTSPAEFTCSTPAPLASGVCEVSAGASDKLIIGTILAPTTILRGGQVHVNDAGQIDCVGCDCGTDAPNATVINCPQAVVSPGLINPHDHITFAHNVPYTDSGERYEHRNDWRRGRNGHTRINTLSNASRNQIRFGELRFLMGGATSVIGAGSATGFLRNLDRDDQEGLGQTPVELDVFPLGDGSGVQRDQGCFYPNITNAADIAAEDSYSPHVAEGIDAFARNEFLCLSRDDNGGQDLLEPQSAFIHGAGLTPIDYTRMNDQGTYLIWSPRSNITLYGNTASVTAADRLNVPIALGTDWIPTGSMNLLRELRCADGLNSNFYNTYFSDKDLWKMVTANAAEAAAMDDVIGTLVAGNVADIAIYDGSTHTDFRAIIDAEPADVSLVIRGGDAIYGDEAVITALAGGGCDSIDVCGTNKSLCTMSEIGMSLAALQADVGAMYDLFFCVDPTNEPSCTPARPASVNGSTIYDGIPTATDNDGDGIENDADNCPNVFNPVRPLDDGVQADFDGDGEGDMCDECPMDANVTDCKPFDPNDPDGDGVANADDNCPELSNADQTDGDSDGRGDVCDACPASPNPAPIACPATIYEIKTGQSESLVTLSDTLVTACVQGRGYFLQVHPGDAGYVGAENSGIFVFDPNTDCGVNITAGDRINITPSAQVGEFFGQIQLSFATFAVASSDNPMPPATVLTTAQAGGSSANEYEGILATVENVTVTDIAPAPGPGDSAPTNEFVVDTLRVDDLLHLTANFPANGAVYDSITGILAFRNANQKIHPRMEADLVPGPPALTAFAPATAFARVGDMAAPTIPTPLTVTLSSPPVADLLIPITSSDETALTVEGGGATVLAGETTAVVLVNGLAQSAAVTLTATLDGNTFTADVRVVDGAEVAAVSSLEPAMGAILLGTTLDMTVSLDIPAGVGGETVMLATAPGTSGSVPATVVVNENELSATFTFTAGMVVGTETITATLGASSATATVDVLPLPGLIINEVDYDNVGGDTEEYVELYNYSLDPIDITNIVVVFINGNGNSQYREVRLVPVGDPAVMLAAGDYVVIGSQTLLDSIDNGSYEVYIGAPSNTIQNGAPDGIALIDAATSTLMDALSYEGSITAGVTTSYGTFNLVEGTAATASDSNSNTGSVCRIPNGTDTDNADNDWAFSTTLTPGTANVP